MSRSASILFILVSVLFAGCWGSGEAKDKSSRDTAFKEVFGFDVPSSAVDVKSSWFFLRDSYVRWLRVSCDEATISKIRSLHGSKPSTSRRTHDAPGRSERNPNAPDWWIGAKVSPHLEEFEINRSKPSESDIVSVWIDQNTQTVYAARNVSH